MVCGAVVSSVAFEYSISQRTSFDPGTQMKNFAMVGFVLTVELGGKYVGGVAVGVGFGHRGSNTFPLQLNGSSLMSEASVVKTRFDNLLQRSSFGFNAQFMNAFGILVVGLYLTVANGDGGLNVKISKFPFKSSVTR